LTEFKPDKDQVGFVAESLGPDLDPNKITWRSIPDVGSDRSFVRVIDGDRSHVLVTSRDLAENRAYEAIGRHLWSLNRAGPEFIAVDHDHGFFLLEDLGDIQLLDAALASSGRETVSLYKKVVRLVAYVHREAGQGFDTKWCYQTPFYDKTLILERETGYFTGAFLGRHLGITDLDPGLEAEFESLAEAALTGTERTFMHRDFQSRNIMLKDGRPRLVDFQGARLGPPGYDLASLLYDPYIDLAGEVREEIKDYYIGLRHTEVNFNARAFNRSYYFLAVCRLLQALGAYGFLYRVKGIAWFKEQIPAAVRSLDGLLHRPEMSGLPRLGRTVKDVRSRIES